MPIPQDIIEKVRENNDIIDLISEYVSLKKRGKNYIGLCPFHSEKTPSFSVQPDKQMYYCFGCGEGGNVITFLMKNRNIGFIDAVKMLAERANIIIPDKDNEMDYKKVSLKEKIYQINREAARYFYLNLRNSKAAFNYFVNRGISVDIIKKFGLGYSIDSFNGLLNYLTSKGYSLELVEQSGLIVKNEKGRYYDRFRNRVMFPVIDTRGRIIGFGGRVLDNSKPKYLNSPDTLIFNKGDNLYGLNLVSNNNKEIIIVEGYMDTIALHQYGITNAVASLGTALTQNQAKLLKRYSEEIIISYDSDAAGQAATLRGLDILSSTGCKVSVLQIPRGKDPDDFIRAEGKDAFLKSIDNAMPLVEYKIKRNNDGHDTATTEGKIGFIKSSAQELAKIDDPITVDAYIRKLSNETGIESSVLYDEVKKYKNMTSKFQVGDEGHINGKSRYNNNVDGQKLYLENAHIKAEVSLLYILYEKKGYLSIIEKKISAQDFNDLTYRKAAGIIFEKIKNNEDIIPADIISCFDTETDMKKVSKIFNDKTIIDSNNINEIIDDYVYLIKKNKLMMKRESLISQMKEAEKKGDVQQLAQLLKEIVEIEKHIRE